MSAGPRGPGDLEALAAAAAREAARLGRPRPVALRAELAAPGGAPDLPTDGEGFVFERPTEGRSVAARGVAWVIECEGPERFAEAARRARELFAALPVAGDAAPAAAGPLLVGGFGFDPVAPGATHWAGFPAGRLVLPEVSRVREGGRAWCTVARAVAPGADPVRESAALRAALAAELRAASAPVAPVGASAPARTLALRPDADYCARVAAALRQIGAGELEKVVVARALRVTRGEPFPPGALLATLRRLYPSCASFAVARPGAVFLGASPERLVRRQGRRVETAAVAGSAPRGRTPAEDARLARALCESKKEQAEHAVVVRALREALEECCAELEVAESPRLMRVDGIQHLDTPVVGTLASDLSVLELAGRLHPTPAVAGAPREAALAWLAREEGLERGWYAAPVGYVDAAGDGEFCAALRSALLRGGEAYLFAGAGIVAGSRPEAELRETHLKLRALLAPLREI